LLTLSAPPGFQPPRPRPQPKPLGPVALLKALRRNPIECWTRAHFEQPIVPGGFPFARVVTVSNPQAIRKLLVENPHRYRKSALERRILSPRLRQGLVAVEGARWETQRRTLAPMFSRKTVMQLSPAMAEAAAALVQRWRARGHDGALDLKIEMSSLALDGLVRSIFQEGLGGDRDAMRAAMVAFFATTGRIDPFDLMGLPDFVPRISQWWLRGMLRAFDGALEAAIATRRRKLDSAAEKPRDMLGAMLAAADPETGARLSDAEVKANVLTFIFAGQETTSTALTWALYLLSQSPEWAARVTAESERELTASGETAVERLVETRAVLDEAMRLYPPIVGITRTAKQRDELAGHSIERGTMVVVSPYVLHRHQLLWNDPDTFDPSRFLERASRAIDRYAYLPFGVGPRMCIGAGFALQEATLVLATIMSNFAVALAPGQSVWPLQRFTLRPRDPLMMVIRPRA
jgi:cytochrome P450